MKTFSVTQTYELEISFTVEVPDDYTLSDVRDNFEDFPISIVVEPEWDESEFDDSIFNNDIIVQSLVSTETKAYDDNGILGM